MIGRPLTVDVDAEFLTEWYSVQSGERRGGDCKQGEGEKQKETQGMKLGYRHPCNAYAACSSVWVNPATDTRH